MSSSIFALHNIDNSQLLEIGKNKGVTFVSIMNHGFFIEVGDLQIHFYLAFSLLENDRNNMQICLC
jgi:hypothetical protein